MLIHPPLLLIHDLLPPPLLHLLLLLFHLLLLLLLLACRQRRHQRLNRPCGAPLDELLNIIGRSVKTILLLRLLMQLRVSPIPHLLLLPIRDQLLPPLLHQLLLLLLLMVVVILLAPLLLARWRGRHQCRKRPCRAAPPLRRRFRRRQGLISHVRVPAGDSARQSGQQRVGQLVESMGEEGGRTTWDSGKGEVNEGGHVWWDRRIREAIGKTRGAAVAAVSKRVKRG